MRVKLFIVLVAISLFVSPSFAQSITITNPDFEDKFRQTEIIPITWSSSGIDHYELSYTTDPSEPCEGDDFIGDLNRGCTEGDWNCILGFYDKKSFNWFAPGIDSNRVRIRIEGMDDRDVILTEECSDEFTISNEVLRGSVRITEPFFKDVFGQGDSINIQWSSEDVDHFEISYTTDPEETCEGNDDIGEKSKQCSEGSWTCIDADHSSESLSWKAPKIESDNVRVRVEGQDDDNNIVALDCSDEFTIRNETIEDNVIISRITPSTRRPRCDPLQCATRTRTIGRTYCLGNSVFQDYREYRCYQDSCVSSIKRRQQEACEDFCSEWGGWHFVDYQEQERSRVCYDSVCFRGSCIQENPFTVFSSNIVEKETVIKNITKQSIFDFDVDVYSLLKEKTQEAEKRIFSGLLFGDDTIEIPVDEFLGEMDFEVRDTNKYGNLVIFLNDEIIYNNITSEGNYSISIDKNFTGFVKVKAVSSGWRLWSPAIYDVNIKVIQKSRKEKDDESDFIVYDYMLDNFQQALITGGPDIGTISLNNIQLNSTDIKKEQIVEGANRLRFLPTQDKSFKGEASIKIIYAEEVES